jgi:hypothetical protein
MTIENEIDGDKIPGLFSLGVWRRPVVQAGLHVENAPDLSAVFPVFERHRGMLT